MHCQNNKVKQNDLKSTTIWCHRKWHLLVFSVWKPKATEDDCCSLSSSVTQPWSEQEPVQFIHAVSH